ncbi:unnamed protein product [Rotaria sp. Silwood2]|nr:unnamed protein product [Rotaria sp. Silwood2]CAF4417259.1 unnamed protein product [Rotaria sp. Silwood2]
MARLNRLECWSRSPDTVSIYAVTDANIINKKIYSGIGTAETCTLLQYVARLKQEGYEVNGHPLKAVVATARMDNEDPWKSNAKAGMTLYAVHVSSNYVSNIRYELRKKM